MQPRTRVDSILLHLGEAVVVAAGLTTLMTIILIAR
jgi:hypothetical protein